MGGCYVGVFWGWFAISDVFDFVAERGVLDLVGFDKDITKVEYV